ncbi:MAG: bifunctional phosphoribosylaminoimidazolecarboxamide formyltransferase/IMP cyclohydrolase [Elusimicrobia bacterium]|nr:bifunctional phosphoribosylaminoimidazolecarboxamide formyltransferase/IMP cyclohydrolase [Elusimicrobiota bacterium]
MNKVALISVSNKLGIVPFAQELEHLGFAVYATGKTAQELESAQIDVSRVEEITGFPEILGGRVKTLHPKILGAILANPSDPAHRKDMERHGIEPIGLVVVNLYPFEEMMEAREEEELLREFIDIGGVSLIRSAAKNYPNVVIVTDPKDYNWIIEKLKAFGEITAEERRILAYKAFEHTAHYDATIASYFRTRIPATFPEELTLRLKKVEDLRYGENPHQKAALYTLPKARRGIVHARALQGKQMSFNNYLDLEAAWNLVREFEETACVIIKHSNPCGAATSENLSEAFERAFNADSLSAFGGIVAFNREVDPDTAKKLSEYFLECVIAPDYHSQSLDILKPKKNLRLLAMTLREVVPIGDFDYRAMTGGFLVQEKDFVSFPPEYKIVTKREPTQAEWRDLKFAWKVAKHVKSNAIVLACEHRTVGIGGGQTSRIDALKNALLKIQERKTIARSVTPLVMASDGFFPFNDAILEASQRGVTAIIQPGGSIRDEDSIQAANEKGLSMVFTGLRHFLH